MWDELRGVVPADVIVCTQTKRVAGCEQTAERVS